METIHTHMETWIDYNLDQLLFPHTCDNTYVHAVMSQVYNKKVSMPHTNVMSTNFSLRKSTERTVLLNNAQAYPTCYICSTQKDI